MDSKTLTIFTPAYNRAHTLVRTYESLCRQTCKDFEWLIVDDGSQDNTRELVDSWIKEGKIPIRYIYQHNQGMHAAHNTAYDNIVTDGEINVQDRGNMGSGHGWSGVTQVLWNCRVKRAAIQSPWVSGDNYSIGTKGEKYPGHFKDRPYGHWEGQNEINVFPRSLYIAQLMARHGLDLTILTK